MIEYQQIKIAPSLVQGPHQVPMKRNLPTRCPFVEELQELQPELQVVPAALWATLKLVLWVVAGECFGWHQELQVLVSSLKVAAEVYPYLHQPASVAL